MKAEEILNECEGLTPEDTEEMQLRASNQIKEICKNNNALIKLEEKK